MKTFKLENNFNLKIDFNKIFESIYLAPVNFIKWILLLHDEKQYKTIIKRAEKYHKKSKKFITSPGQMFLVIEISKKLDYSKFIIFVSKIFKTNLLIVDRLPRLIIVNNDSRHKFNKDLAKMGYDKLTWSGLRKVAYFETEGNKRKTDI